MDTTIRIDVLATAERCADRPLDELRLLCEQAVRNHGPCISGATHLVSIERQERR